ncbi:hypothetical protein ACHAWF_000709 [Thalassiosira exigua]
MRKQVDDFVKSCDECQRYKITGKRDYGKLPAVPALRDREPWEKIQVDCAGPWTIRVKTSSGKAWEYSFHIMTMVDCCTNWCELKSIPSANSKSCANTLDTAWLCRAPRPAECGHDNGPEFMGEEFQEMLHSFGIKPKPTTVKNPTAQAIVERLHLILGEQLRTTVFKEDRYLEDLDVLVQT